MKEYYSNEGIKRGPCKYYQDDMQLNYIVIKQLSYRLRFIMDTIDQIVIFQTEEDDYGIDVKVDRQ